MDRQESILAEQAKIEAKNPAAEPEAIVAEPAAPEPEVTPEP